MFSMCIFVCVFACEPLRFKVSKTFTPRGDLYGLYKWIIVDAAQS